MKRDSLETDEIVAGGNSSGDGSGPGGVLGDHLAVGPRAAVDGAGEQPGLVDLEPLERVRVDASAARAGALGEVRELYRGRLAAAWVLTGMQSAPWGQSRGARSGSSRR